MPLTNGKPENDSSTPEIPDMSREEKIEFLKMLDAKRQQVKDASLENMTFSLIQEEIIVAILNGEAKTFEISGGNQSGKSSLGAVVCTICLTGIIPLSIRSRVNLEKFQMIQRDLLSLALDHTYSYVISQAKVFKYLPQNQIGHFSKEFRILTTKNQSSIMFRSVESGEEKVQGFEVNGVWVDEEPKNELIWDEAILRTVTRRGWMLLTFSPLMGLTWAYHKLYKKAFSYTFSENIHGIPEEVGLVHTVEEINKMRERRLVTQYNKEEFADESIRFYQMTMYDNIHLPAEEIQRQERRLKDDILQYKARILGRFAKLIGREVFNTAKLEKMQAAVRHEGKKYELINGQVQLSVKGRLLLWDSFKDKEGRVYVIGADSAEGTIEGDYSCAQILDRTTGEQVGIWHGHVPPEEFARVLYDIGKYFNWAKLVPERNMHGVGIIAKLRELKYPNLYYHYDVSNEAVSRTDMPKKTFGWITSYKSKPIMIQQLAAWINEGKIRINDLATLEELITYSYDEDGRTNARKGSNDDRVMALAIAVMGFRKTPANQHIVGKVTRYEKDSSSSNNSAFNF